PPPTAPRRWILAVDPWLPGVHASPNIQRDPELYERENRAMDPEGSVLAAMADLAPWRDRVVLDLGAGTGFWLPHVAGAARHVFAVEPHDASRALAMARVVRGGLRNVSVLAGSAE